MLLMIFTGGCTGSVLLQAYAQAYDIEKTRGLSYEVFR